MSSTALRKTLRVALWSLGWLVLGVLAVKAFYGDVYYVDSPSMEPTLHGADEGGEYVFVRYERRPQLERFDLVVFMRAGELVPLVKRVVALPKEEVQVSGGDLFINGVRLPSDAPRPPLIELFNSERDDFAIAFNCPAGHWAETVGAWRLDARGQREQFAQWNKRLTDDYRGPDGKLVAGKQQVGDARIELDVRLEGDCKRLALRLSEEADVFEVELTPNGPGSAHASLSRARSRGAPAQLQPIGVLAEADVPLANETWHRMVFGNIDNELRFELDGQPALQATYATNTPLSGARDSAMIHAPPRIAFGGDDLVAQFRNVRVARDINYTGGPGRHGTELSQSLVPDEIFVLGDNSSESKDSREWGPVKLGSVIGKPLWVVWPPSRRRPLLPTEAPSK